MKAYDKQTQENPTEEVDLSRKRGECGGHLLKFTPEIGQLLIEINDKHWGKLSIKKLAGKLTSAGHKCSPTTMRRWCKALGATRRRRYVKPKLTDRHRYNRLQWVLNEYDKTTGKFGDNANTCHGDENWFYLMLDGTVARVFPRFTRVEGQVERTVPMPADVRVYHKSRMPKIMFLALTAKPCPEHDFDGKIGIWPFTVTRKAKHSSNTRTGTVAGKTDVLELVTVIG